MTKTKGLLFTAGISLATAFTISCGDHDISDVIQSSGSQAGGERDESSSSIIASSSSGGSSSSRNEIVYGSFTDERDGKEYKTIAIGEQTWLAENLNFQEEQIGPTRGSKCYNDIESNCEKYGRLYEWDDAVEVCPDGWHLPSVSEWNALTSFVGANPGKKLKAADSLWTSNSGTDDYGFAALPGGWFTNEFAGINTTGYWWTATEYGTTGIYASHKSMTATNNDVSQDYDNKTRQLSVRCVLGPSSLPPIVYGSFTDERDSKEYKTIAIGEQTWLAENLNFQEEQIGQTRGSKCYDDIESNCAIYGRLYEWDDALEVCPAGWHLPTASEWNALASSVGSNPGKKLKAKASDWGDGYGRDNYGFAALPGGWFTNEFAGINTGGYWWTATEYGTNGIYASHKSMTATNNDVSQDYDYKTRRLSVRCVLGPSSSSSIVYGEHVDPRDGKKYRTVRIGNKNWMAENLNYEAEGSVCYDNKESNCDKYGRLYNWETAKTTACPSGWELPTVSEWNALASSVGAPAGKQLKAKASDWGDGYGRDNYGFAALPGGWFTNEFAGINTGGYWWTATEYGTNGIYASHKSMTATNNDVSQDYDYKTRQLSVRCVEK